ncbi:hypothetical protein NM688_g4774 [Phlebia brevispora]|uniref:Uncharacterized protein n=1 Tax=Phlebia brevispora TaxID=194682 RepID=A0ACC1T254_9APHY|nr:hypothetical protein NM688_g4774 [Phlebia brevispora]
MNAEDALEVPAAETPKSARCKLSSSIWATLPEDLLGEIAPHLADDFFDTPISLLIQYSQICRLWRAKLSPYIFYQIILPFDLDPLENAPPTTEALQGNSSEEGVHPSLKTLHHFLLFLREAQASSRPIMSHIKRLLVVDEGDAGRSGRTPRTSDTHLAKRGAELLVDILSHFSRLRKFTMNSLMPIDGFRLAELVEPGPDPEQRTTPWTPLAVNKLSIRLYGNHLGPPQNGFPRFVGLLTLFGKIDRLDLHNGEREIDPFRGTVLPSLPTHLQIPDLHLHLDCTQPSFIRTVITLPIASSIQRLELQDLDVEDMRELMAVLSDPVLKYRHLVLDVEDPPETEAPMALNLASKSLGRLDEVTLRLYIADCSDEPPEEARLSHYRTVKWAINMLSALNTPCTSHSIRMINLAVDGTYALDPYLPGILDTFDELDQLLVDLHEGECRIRISITVQDFFDDPPKLTEQSNELRAELFPLSLALIEGPQEP